MIQLNAVIIRVDPVDARRVYVGACSTLEAFDDESEVEFRGSL